jgi:hypothetical protein
LGIVGCRVVGSRVDDRVSGVGLVLEQ